MPLSSCHTQCLSTVLRWYLRVIGCGHRETPAESLNQVHLLCPCAVLRHSAWLRVCPGGPAPDGDVSTGWPPGDLRHWGHGSREGSSDVSSSRGHFNSIGSSVLSEGGALGHMMPEWGPAGVPTSGGKGRAALSDEWPSQVPAECKSGMDVLVHVCDSDRTFFSHTLNQCPGGFRSPEQWCVCRF